MINAKIELGTRTKAMDEIKQNCDNLRSGSEESGSGCVKVFSEPGFIVAGNGSTRGYFG